jgi:hypothetical protein
MNKIVKEGVYQVRQKRHIQPERYTTFGLKFSKDIHKIYLQKISSQDIIG